ncbi:hypothetical protein AB0I89_23910 [Micromonospora sp. NPDC049801]|uniref:hypothetical protein n=1 Tax=unclassified Micromonospora TaxID=2617518 RepID=UPI0033F2A6A8
MTTWQWEAYGLDGDRMIVDTLTDPFAGTVGEAADMAMAQLMVRARPDFRRLAGWRVRAWVDGAEAWAYADDWLRTVEAVGR